MKLVRDENGKRSRIPTGWFAEGKVLSIDQLCAAAPSIPKMDDSCLFLWCPNGNIPGALKVMGAWGFQYKTNFVWLKTFKDITSDGYCKPRTFSLGYWSFANHEMLLFGVSGKFRRDSPHSVFPRSVFPAPFVNMGGGYKPDIIYEQIEKRYTGPWLELFSRRRRPGWFHHGNDVGGGSDISIPEWDNVKPRGMSKVNPSTVAVK